MVCHLGDQRFHKLDSSLDVLVENAWVDECICLVRRLAL